MKTFRDESGREWAIVIHVSAIKRVRELLGIDLYKLIDDGFKPLGELMADPVRLVDVLYVLCKREADERHVSDEQFGEAMYGETIERAGAAFLDEFAGFFPPRVQAGLRKLIAETDKVRGHLLDDMDRRLAGIDAESEARSLIASFGNSPDNSASTPENGP